MTVEERMERMEEIRKRYDEIMSLPSYNRNVIEMMELRDEYHMLKNSEVKSYGD